MIIADIIIAIIIIFLKVLVLSLPIPIIAGNFETFHKVTVYVILGQRIFYICQKLHYELCLQREEATELVLRQNAQRINDTRTE